MPGNGFNQLKLTWSRRSGVCQGLRGLMLEHDDEDVPGNDLLTWSGWSGVTQGLTKFILEYEIYILDC